MNIAIFLFIVFFAYLLQGIIGFGAGLVSVPLALVFLDKETVITSVTVLGLVSSGVLIKQIDEPLNYRVFLPLFIASVLGMPVGILILQLTPLNELKMITGVLSLFFTVILLFPRLRLPKRLVLILVPGFLCGILSTSTATPGPPAVLVLSAMGISKDGMRKILVTFFFWMSVAGLPLFIVSNIFTFQRATPGAVAAPFIFLAGYLGDRISRRIPPRMYKGLALVVIGMTSLYGIYSGLQVGQ
ncbi:MAG: sulfite exporter TauE/SafE family protein [Ktedonobacteraceae bacterium]|nr:sulfite exporter TauE/SafE family protein [Ktedonobacteraceae bacterium]